MFRISPYLPKVTQPYLKTTPISFSKSRDSVQFGFTKDCPADFKYPLRQEDLSGGQAWTPSEQWIANIVNTKLLGEGDHIPRAVGFIGPRTIFKSRENFLTFIANVVEKTGQYFYKHHPEILRPVRYEDLQNLTVNPQSLQQDYTLALKIRKNIDGFGENNGQVTELQQGKKTIKYPHFDYFQWPLFALVTGDWQNIAPGTGLSFIADVRHYLKNTQQGLRNIIDIKELEKLNSTRPRKAHFKPLEEYRMIFDGVNLSQGGNWTALLVLNRLGPEGQIVHGAIEPEKHNPNQEAARPLDHIYLEVTPKPFQAN